MQNKSLAAAILLVAACGHDPGENACVSNDECVLQGTVGTCRPSPVSDSQWCSYPDGACAGGDRWSSLAGDGLAELCVTESDAGTVDAILPTQDASIDAPPDDAAPGTWGDPELVANVNSADDDYQPCISADGLALYFVSTRAPNQGLGDIWVATRASTTQPFATPTPVDTINSSGNEQSPEISADGLELFFYKYPYLMVSTRASTASAWSAPTQTTVAGANSPSLSASGLSLYYTSGAPVTIKRVTRSVIGGAWGGPTEVPLPGDLHYYGIDISGDELRILVSEPNAVGPPLVMQGDRSSPTASFTALETIPALGYDTTNKDAAWNSTESEIYLAADRLIGVGGRDIYVSVLN